MHKKKGGGTVQKRLGIVLYIALAAVALALLLMTVLASAGMGDVWQGAPLVIVLTVFAILLIAALVLFNPRKNAYSIGFYLLHAGILFFLAGGLLYQFFGHSVQVAPPNVASLTPGVQAMLHANGMEVPNGYYNQIPGREDTIADLGFNFRVVDFDTEYYDTAQTEVRHYQATLGFLEAGEEVTRELTVNHPLYYGGWKIYLMAVTADPVYGYEKVQLLIKRDPGEILSTTGILLTVFGTFSMCFIRPHRLPANRKKSREDAQ